MRDPTDETRRTLGRRGLVLFASIVIATITALAWGGYAFLY